MGDYHLYFLPFLLPPPPTLLLYIKIDKIIRLYLLSVLQSCFCQLFNFSPIVILIQCHCENFLVYSHPLVFYQVHFQFYKFHIGIIFSRRLGIDCTIAAATTAGLDAFSLVSFYYFQNFRQLLAVNTAVRKCEVSMFFTLCLQIDFII